MQLLPNFRICFLLIIKGKTYFVRKDQLFFVHKSEHYNQSKGYMSAIQDNRLQSSSAGHITIPRVLSGQSVASVKVVKLSRRERRPSSKSEVCFLYIFSIYW